jgi:hypothetical protein
MNRRSSTWRTLAISGSLLLLVGVGSAAHGARGYAAESRARVRLVRLLEEVPDSERTALGGVHDLRLRLEPGNILLLRRGGESAAMLPIEVSADGKDSLRYFYYLEHANFLWVFPGQRDKGIGTVGNGGSIHINAFDLKWRARKDALGWIYFAEDPSSQRVRFSVVSGRTVDEADPMDTKYWIELGPAEASGF